MIEIENLTKTYEKGSVRTEVLKGMAFKIGRGEYVAIMGPSGTGKSTLMNILGCMDRPSGGRYVLDGEDVGSLGDDALSRLRNRKIGFVFQQFHLIERASALRNVSLPLLYAEDLGKEAEARAERLLETVGLGDRKHHRPGELSGGQQQRVAIARALVTDPAFVLADEPTGNLDARSGAEILALFQKLNRDGRTLIVVTHDPVVAQHARRVIVLSDGRISEDRVVSQPRDAEAGLKAAGESGA